MPQMEPEKSRDLFGREIEFKVLRFAPDRDKRPYFQSYKLMLQRGMTVLDALMHIKENQDPTLNYRKSCRMGICGSCAMYVNNKPVLACQTQAAELRSTLIEVRPLPNFPVIRDLVPDLTAFFSAHESAQPFLVRKNAEEIDSPVGEYIQSPEGMERYLQFAYCIKCACCVAACPTCATDSDFTGPQALAAAYRYTADSRDEGLTGRAGALDHPHGLWRCHFAGACSEACPKGVDPALGIQLLKREILKHKLNTKERLSASLSPRNAGGARREGIPDAPPRTAQDKP